MEYIKIDQSAAGTTVIKAATAGQQVLLFGLFGTLADAGTIQLVDSDGTALTGAMEVAADTPVAFGGAGAAILSSAGNKGLSITTGTGKFKGWAAVRVT